MSRQSFNFNSKERLEPWMRPIPVAPIPEQSGSSKFIGLSAVAHASLLAALLFATNILVEIPKTETISIEIAGDAAPMPAPTPALPEPPVVASTPEAAAPAAAPAPIAPKAVAHHVAAKAAPAPKMAPAAKIAVSDDNSPVAVPASLEDIKEPELATDAIATAPTEKLKDEDIESSLAKVDEDHDKTLAGIKNELDQDADQVNREQEENLQAANQEAQKEAAVLAAKSEALKDKNAKDAAAALAAENARKVAAARQAAEAAAAADRAAAGQRRQAEIAAANSARGQGKGNGAQSGTTAGTNGVRSLEQLRQKPGNPTPKYSEGERIAGQQGSAVFLAYVNKEGMLSQIRQVQSTGHSNLDSKTLNALKQWKFYPGQEGWVEIPIRWDLRGGPQETSALFRRKVSQRDED